MSYPHEDQYDRWMLDKVSKIMEEERKSLWKEIPVSTRRRIVQFLDAYGVADFSSVLRNGSSRGTALSSSSTMISQGSQGSTPIHVQHVPSDLSYPVLLKIRKASSKNKDEYFKNLESFLQHALSKSSLSPPPHSSTGGGAARLSKASTPQKKEKSRLT